MKEESRSQIPAIESQPLTLHIPNLTEAITNAVLRAVDARKRKGPPVGRAGGDIVVKTSFFVDLGSQAAETLGEEVSGAGSSSPNPE